MATTFQFVQIEKALNPDSQRGDFALLSAVPAAIASLELDEERKRGNLLDPIVRVDRIPLRTQNGRVRGKQLAKARKMISFTDRNAERVTKDGTQRVRPKNASLKAWSEISKLSPQGNEPSSPQYSREHVMFYNGKKMPAGSAAAQLNNIGDSLIFVNRMPYAKRLEGVRVRRTDSLNKNSVVARQKAKLRGLKGGARQRAILQNKVASRRKDVTPESAKYMSKRAPNGVYNVAAARLARQYRGLLNVRFMYLEVNQFYGMGYDAGNPWRNGNMGGDSGIVRSTYVRSKRAMVFPAILITLDDAFGLTEQQSTTRSGRGRVQ